MAAFEFSREQQELLRELSDLGLDGMETEMENQLANSSLYATVSFEKRIGKLAAAQKDAAAARRYKELLAKAGIRDCMTFNDLHFTPGDGISQEDLIWLSEAAWAQRRPENVIIQGPTGAGKTALATAAAVNLCRMGITVKYFRWFDLSLEVQTKGADAHALRLFMKNLCRCQVLIIDDLGLSGSVGPELAAFMFALSDMRYRSKPIIITSQIRDTAYTDLFGGTAQAEAISSRLRNPAKIITLEGESKRAQRA